MACLSVTIIGLGQSGFTKDAVQLRVIHADPMTTKVSVQVDGATVSKVLKPRQSDSLELPPAIHTISLVDPETSESITNTQPITMRADHCYTFVIVRETTAPGSAIKPLIVPAECKPPEGSKANATFVLAAPSVEKVDVYAGWVKIISNLKRGEFEGPKTIPAGDYKVTAKEGSRLVLGPIELSPKAGHSYTIVAFDNANSAAEGEQLTHRIYEDVFTTASK